MKPEAKMLRKGIIESVVQQKKEQGFIQANWAERILKLSVVIHEDWYTKKHAIKKKDIANREKFLIDALMAGLGLDDSQIWEHRLVKRVEHDVSEFKAVIDIGFYKP